MARIDSSRNFNGTVGTDDVTAFDENDQGLLGYSNSRDANGNGTGQLSQKYEQVLAEVFARYPGSQSEYEAKLSTWRAGDQDPLEYVLSSKDEDPANGVTGWDYYNSRLSAETEALRGQNRVTLKDNLQQHINLLEADLASGYGPLVSDPNNTTEIQRIKNQANAADNENNPQTAEEIRVHATEAAKKLIFESGSRGEDLRDKNRDATAEFNALVAAKLSYTDPSLTGAQKNAFDAKQRDAARNIQDLWNELINKGLQECQALIIIKMEALEWASPNGQSNHPDVWLPQNFAAGELTEFDKILLQSGNLNPNNQTPLNQAAHNQLTSIMQEREDLINILRGSYISSLDDLGIVLGNPQNNQNNQNQQQQNQNSLQALHDNINNIRGRIGVDPTKEAEHGSNTDEWSERQAGRGRISTFSFMRKNTKKKLENARDEWMNSATQVVMSYETSFNRERPALKIAYEDLYNAQHALDPNDPDYLDDNAFNAKMAGIDQELDSDLAQALENIRHDMMTEATILTQNKVNKNTEGKNKFTRGFLKMWGILSGGSDSNKGMGKFFRKHKILGKLAKAGLISAAALPFGLAASVIFSGIGVGAGAALGAGLLARGVARGIAGAKMDTQTNQSYVTDAIRRCEQILDQIRNNPQLNMGIFGDMTHGEVGRRLTENRLRMGKSVALGATLGLALGTVGHALTDWVPNINMPWSHGASAPTGGNLPPNSGIGGNIGIGNGLTKTLIGQTYKIPSGGSIIHNVISQVPGVTDTHANDAYTWLANQHGGTAGLQRYIEANTVGANNVYNGGSGIGVGITNPGLLKVNAKLANEISKAIVATRA